MMKSRSDKSQNTYKIVILIVLILGAILIFSTNFFRSYVSDVISKAYTRLFVNQNEYTSIIEENNNLRNKIEELNIYIARNGELSNLRADGMIEVIKATSVFKSDKINFLYSEVLINKGEQDGVNLGDIVMFAGLSPVGYISKLNQNSSLVTLYSASGNVVEVLLESLPKNVEIVSVSIDTKPTSTDLVSTSTDPVFTPVSQNMQSLEAVGDGKYGLLIKSDYSLQIATGSSVYLRSNPDYKLGNVIFMNNNESTKEKYIYIRPNYSIKDSSIFYILK